MLFFFFYENTLVLRSRSRVLAFYPWLNQVFFSSKRLYWSHYLGHKSFNIGLAFIRLSLSHDPGRRLTCLTSFFSFFINFVLYNFIITGVILVLWSRLQVWHVNPNHFFCHFLIDFFFNFIIQYNVDWELGLVIYFDLFFIELL